MSTDKFCFMHLEIKTEDEQQALESVRVDLIKTAV